MPAAASTLPTQRAIRVLVADRHAAFRKGVRLALESAGFAVVAECADAPATLDDARRLRPEICLLDVELPGGGIGAARALGMLPRPPRIVMLAAVARDADFFAALRAGAIGYLPKDVEPSRLAEELSGVAAGRPALPPEMAARLIEEFRALSRRSAASVPPAAERVTSREWEVLVFLAAGASTKQVSARLGLAPATVRRHVSSALRKLGLPDRSAAVEYVRTVQRSERE